MRNESKSHWQTETELKEEIKSILDKGYNTISTLALSPARKRKTTGTVLPKEK